MKYLLGARDNTNFGTIKGARKNLKKKKKEPLLQVRDDKIREPF